MDPYIVPAGELPDGRIFWVTPDYSAGYQETAEQRDRRYAAANVGATLAVTNQVEAPEYLEQ